MRHEGSAAFTQIVRGGLLLGQDPDDDTDNRRVLAVTSSNLAAHAPSLVYEIESVTVPSEEGPIDTARIGCVGESTANGSDLLRPSSHDDGEGERPALQEATTFLLTELAGGPKLVDEVSAIARRQGIAPRTLRRARQALKIKSAPREFGGPWQWSLQSGPPPMVQTGESDDGPDCQSPVSTGDYENGRSSLDHPIVDGPFRSESPLEGDHSTIATPEQEALFERLRDRHGEPS